MSKPPAELERFLQFLSTSEGRDKSGKVIQYGCRFLKWHQEGKNQDVFTAVKNVQSKCRPADQTRSRDE